MRISRCLSNNHEYLDGKKCFWCGEPKPVPNGKWPTGTWFQQRLAVVKAREIAPALRTVARMKTG